MITGSSFWGLRFSWWGVVVILFFFWERFCRVLSICLVQEWWVGLHIRGCGSVVWFLVADSGFRGVVWYWRVWC